MAIKRIRPIADIVLQAQGRRFEYEKIADSDAWGSNTLHSFCDGFGQSVRLHDVLQRNEWLARNHVQLYAGPVGEPDTGGLWTPCDMSVEEAAGAYFCAPIIDVWQSVRMKDFDCSPAAVTVGGSSVDPWEEQLYDIGVVQDYAGSDVHHYQVNQRVSEKGLPVMRAISRFTLPPNPFFVVALNRGEPHDDHEEDAYTAIIFGGTATTGYALVIPFREPPHLRKFRIDYDLRFYADERGVNPQEIETPVWEKLEGSEISLGVPSREGFAKGERAFIWIGVIGGMIAVSTDGFQRDVNLWGPQSMDETPTGIGSYGTVWVHEGSVAVEGRGCEFAFSVFPCRMFTSFLRSELIGAGYNTQNSTGVMTGPTLPFTLSGWPLFNEAGEWEADHPDGWPPLVQISDVSPPKQSDGTEYSGADKREWFRQWELELSPLRTTVEFTNTDGTNRTLYFWRSPQLTAVTHGQHGKVADGGLGADTDLTEDDVKGADGTHGEGGEAGRFQLRLDSQLGQHRARGMRRWVEITPGWVLYDDLRSVDPEYTASSQVFGGYWLESTMGIEAGGGVYMDVPLLDDFLRLAEMRVDGRVPAFDGWYTDEAITWILRRVGIPDANIDLETFRRLLPQRADGYTWKPQKGRLWFDIIQEIVEYDDNGAFWIEPTAVFTKGCRYCRAKRVNDTTSDYHYTKHQHWNDEGCQAIDLTRGSAGVFTEFYTRGAVATDPETGFGELVGLERYFEQLPGHEFATWVEVTGRDERGEPVSVVANCEAAVRNATDPRYTGGWHVHGDPYNLDRVTTQAEAARIARLKLMELCQVNEFVTARTPLDDEIRRGHVFRIRGGEDVDVDAARYRVTALAYDLHRPDGTSWTHVVGRRIDNTIALP